MVNIERAFLRLTFWQTLLSLAGVFTGAVALYATLIQADAVRQQTAAAAWPYIQLMIEDTDDGDRARFALSFRNVGVGPARMQSARVLFDGKPIMSWVDMAQQLVDQPLKLGVDYGRTAISARVLAPEELSTAFQTEYRPLVLALQQAVYGGRMALQYCYCSIFDQCWDVSGFGTADIVRPEPVAQCPDHGASMFRD